MQIEPELLALITGVIGAFLALLWKWLETRYVLPSLDDILGDIIVIVIAARENHDLKDDAARLNWTMDLVEKYLKAKGVDKYFNTRVVIEYAIEVIKQRKEARSKIANN